MRVALDGMGSDNYPVPEVQAAVDAAKEFGDEIILVGIEDQLAPMLAEVNKDGAKVRIVHAPEVFQFTDKISGSVLRKAENSMGVGIDMVKNGEADAFVTMGNTAGAMSIGLARLGRIRGVKRPALTVMLPVKDGHTVLADIGANAECKPEYLLQFAQMGAVYAEKALGISNPRVGLISNGEEAGKGNELVKETYHLLEASGLNFIGNIEGKELFRHEADVAVTDGFTGNVLVKASEAVADLLIQVLREALMSSTLSKIGGLLARPAFAKVRQQLDPGAIGEVPLLGLDGLVFCGHGRSDARAIVSAIRMARQAVAANLMDNLRESIANLV